MRYQKNQEILKEYQKRGTKKRRKDVAGFIISCNKKSKGHSIFSKHVIEACINAVSDYLCIKNITFAVQKSFDEKFCICETCHRHLYKNKIPCQRVCNKMDFDSIPDKLKSIKKSEKTFKLQRNFV